MAYTLLYNTTTSTTATAVSKSSLAILTTSPSSISSSIAFPNYSSRYNKIRLTQQLTRSHSISTRVLVEEESVVELDNTGGDGGGDIGGGGKGKGGGGGGGGGDEEDDQSDNNKKMEAGMSMSQKLTLGYAALVGVGGVMGYVKSGSQKSLTAGGLSALLLYYVYTQLPVRPAFASSVGFGLSAALLAVMGSRYKRSGKIFPAGVVSLVSLIMTGGYLHGILRSTHA